MYSIQTYSNENKHASNKNWFTNNAIIHNIDYKCKNLYLKKRKKKNVQIWIRQMKCSKTYPKAQWIGSGGQHV